MNEKPYSKFGKTYYPKSRGVDATEDKVSGNRWRAWNETGKFYFEFDAGHFATKMKIVEITEDDFGLLKMGKLTDKDLVNKYG